MRAILFAALLTGCSFEVAPLPEVIPTDAGDAGGCTAANACSHRGVDMILPDGEVVTDLALCCNCGVAPPEYFETSPDSCGEAGDPPKLADGRAAPTLWLCTIDGSVWDRACQ